MPEASLKVIPGVDQNKTPALNEAALSSCNLVRFMPDRTGYGLVQKLGGWTKYFPNPMTTATRALWGWEDTNAVKYLAVGNEASTSTYQASLNVITSGNMSDITPRTFTTNPTVSFTTGAASSTVTVTDAGFATNNYDTVYIATPISVGGLILFGFYPTTATSGTTYTIQALDLLGNPQNATAGVVNGGAVPQFTTVNGSSIVTVTLNAHGYSVGQAYPVLIPTLFNGVYIYGNYSILSVPTANTFTIQVNTQAVAGSSVNMNNGKANFVYYVGLGANVSGTGYGVGGYGSGGYGVGTGYTPATGTPVYTNDWVLDNFGQILIGNPRPATTMTFTITAVNVTAGTATVNYTPAYTLAVGDEVTISGAALAAFNGNYYLTSASAGTIQFVTAATPPLGALGASVTAYNSASAPIFQWDPTTGAAIATVMPYGPPVNDGVFVAMPQRQVVAWGSSFDGVQDPLLVRWCDIGNYNVWIAQSTNQAGSYRIPKGSKIVGGIQGPQQALLWTDLAVWSMQYTGQTLIYSFNEIATGCGMIGRKAAVSSGGVVYWMGNSQFFKLDANGVQPIQCPIWDVVFQQIDTANAGRIRAAVNSRFNEVAWYYPTTSGNGDVNAYVKYNTLLQAWDYGTIGRSAWINESVLGPPIGADPSSLYLYQHETSTDADGQAMAAYYQTGYFVLQEADIKAFVDQVWPDAKWGYYGGTQNAHLNLTFYVADFPGQTPVQYGPYTLTQATTWISPRFRGRLVSIYVDSNDVGSWWRIGNMRYRYMPDGKF